MPLVVLPSVMLACWSAKAPPEGAPAGVGSGGVMARTGSGGANGGTGGARATGTARTRLRATPARTAPIAAPDYEFSTACATHDVDARDAGAATSEPAPDAARPMARKPDAAVAPDAGRDAAIPEGTDEGMCAARDPSCMSGHGATSVGSGTCMISGDLLWSDPRSARSRKFHRAGRFQPGRDGLRGCAQVTAEAAGSMEHSGRGWRGVSFGDAAGLTWTAAVPHGVDVYAYTSSGVTNGPGNAPCRQRSGARLPPRSHDRHLLRPAWKLARAYSPPLSTFFAKDALVLYGEGGSRNAAGIVSTSAKPSDS